ncbi:hypothetical protein D9619_000947 [Psilocybe cf. subviscida]|uniref:Caffeine-induced death protein 2 n=1 Tax=Psilocybe cf. subviscida TaxID=2480587 RepID=A0A8H5BCB2_9AGAR|nr:hypothetical protein D9619_000947 [Psilocybe cf. subviscida]
MPPSQPQLGSAAIYYPNIKPQNVNVSSSTCHDLSLFKNILSEYRRLDDAIVVRLNRADASMRDKDRTEGLSGTGTLQDEACQSIWRELVANWKRRTQLVNYCVEVVDQSISEGRTELQMQQRDSAAVQKKTRGRIYENEVKRKQVHRELTIEEIVRKRSAEGASRFSFQTRCRYFKPPMTDEEARKMWNAATGQK